MHNQINTGAILPTRSQAYVFNERWIAVDKVHELGKPFLWEDYRKTVIICLPISSMKMDNTGQGILDWKALFLLEDCGKTVIIFLKTTNALF
jgi:hypothetical protein